MQKFTKIFAVLAQAEMNDELQKALRKVSQMLDLEHEKIKVYFEQHKIPRRPELMRDLPTSNTAKNLEKSIETTKAKSKVTKVVLRLFYENDFMKKNLNNTFTLNYRYTYDSQSV